MDDSNSEDSIPLTSSRFLLQQPAPARRHSQPRPATQAKPAKQQRMLPTARRFWADFTLGFADGLTVPFALTAGLSSLGRTDTVVYAGMAEVSAGCISMGIGGYLSARQSSSSSSSAAASSETEGRSPADDVEASPIVDADEEKDEQAQQEIGATAASVMEQYLAPLSLPSELRRHVLAHIAARPHVSDAVVETMNGYASSRQGGRGAAVADGDEPGSDYCYYDNTTPKDAADDDVWPVAAGFSVALGYLIGGLLPLWPYLCVESVGDGLRWSFAVCVVALFLFGFLRDLLLEGGSDDEQKTSARQLSWRKSRIPWRRLWKSTYEGLQMVVLGGIAAITAVLCVRLFEGRSAESASSHAS